LPWAYAGTADDTEADAPEDLRGTAGKVLSPH
jgi:hypothetical protein